MILKNCPICNSDKVKLDKSKENLPTIKCDNCENYVKSAVKINELIDFWNNLDRSKFTK